MPDAYHSEPMATLYQGDVLEVLASLPERSVDCVMTSPPYWGLRKYSGEQELIWGGDAGCEHEWLGRGDVSDVRKTEIVAGKTRTEERFYGDDETRKFDGQHQKHYQDNTCVHCGAWRGALGLEPTPELYIAHTIKVLRAIRRVMKDSAVCFWNLGDSYGGSGSPGGDYKNGNRGDDYLRPYNCEGGDLKPLDLCLIPEQVAVAAQADGWYVRSIIVWNKPNPMPGSMSGWRWERCRVKVKAQAIGTNPQRLGVVEGLGQKPQRNAPGGQWEEDAQWAPCSGCPRCAPNNGYVLRKGSWRPTSSYEVVLMLAKTGDYYADGEDVREALKSDSQSYFERYEPLRENVYTERGLIRRQIGDRAHQTNSEPQHLHRRGGRRAVTANMNPAGRNFRDVWTITTQPFSLEMCKACKRIYEPKKYKRLGSTTGGHKCHCADDVEDYIPSWLEVRISGEVELLGESVEFVGAGYQCEYCGRAYTEPKYLKLPEAKVKVCSCGASDWLSHFATFPEELVQKCILAGTSARGVCPECGDPWARILEKGLTAHDGKTTSSYDDGMTAKRLALLRQAARERGDEYQNETKTLGWLPTCKCGKETVPAAVLDPFTGSGTTNLVAKKLGRRSVGIDLSEDYLRLARHRLERTGQGMAL